MSLIQCSNDKDTWRCMIGRNSLPGLYPSGALLLDFYVSQCSSIMYTVFKHETEGRWETFLLSAGIGLASGGGIWTDLADPNMS